MSRYQRIICNKQTKGEKVEEKQYNWPHCLYLLALVPDHHVCVGEWGPQILLEDYS